MIKNLTLLPNYLKKAIDIATKAHVNQTDKAGIPYIHHPEYVAQRCKTFESKAAGWLHDVVEDANIELEDLEGWGIPSEVILAVDILTKKKRIPIETYYEKIKGNLIAKEVKINDLIHNLSLMRLNTITKKDIERTQEYLKWLNYLLEDG